MEYPPTILPMSYGLDSPTVEAIEAELEKHAKKNAKQAKKNIKRVSNGQYDNRRKDNSN